MPASPAPLVALLSRSPAAALRLEGMRWYDGAGGGPHTTPLGLRKGRFTADPGSDAPVVPLDGWCLLPGLCDAHLHLFHLARARLAVDLAGTAQRGDLWRRLEEDAPADGPVLGVGWDESAWAEPRFPTRAELDARFPDRPAGIVRVCGHAAVANGPALALLAEQGRAGDAATGLLLEADAAALAPILEPEPAAQREAVGQAAADLARAGLTAVTDMGSHRLPEKAAALPADFPLRVDYFHAGPPSELPPDTGGPARPLGRKFFLDGSIGGRTAALGEAYEGGGRGELLWTDAALEHDLAEALAAGHRVALHAIGDEAVAQALRCLERAAPAPGRARLEHVEIVRTGQLAALSRLGVSACIQPNFLDRWGRPGGLYEQRLGAGYRARFHGPGALRRAGLPLAYGTDGMPARLWAALRAACDETLFGGDADRPAAALAAVTGDAARLAGRDERGRVADGQAADFLLLPDDPVAARFADEPEVALTVLAGRPTWIHPRWQGRPPCDD
ncbi:MAG: amidohydrolase family protein [Candidatus Krumholzibacteriota bacterium]|nr:amidohydrolase family protein [Candidatus Krumholzibacteriota bacterium]